MTKYIFITGGVVSSLGKGIAAASLGALLEGAGKKVTFAKLDPYINIDPGTMSPYQHGEVYVTEDGAETDLDLGHYERFTKAKMRKVNNFTCGKVYAEVTRKERKGEYLGGTIQVIPHITNQIKEWIERAAGDAEVALIEIGGTVGDIESLPFLEAIRQMKAEKARDEVLFIHLTLVPFIATSNEVKTKPTQHSVKELRSIGIQPDLLWCRSQSKLSSENRQKIALFTNVYPEDVFSLVDVKCIYEIPLLLEKQGVGKRVANHLSLDFNEPNLQHWQNIVQAVLKPQGEVTIAVLGKYTYLTDSYKSISEALQHSGIQHRVKVTILYLNAEEDNRDKIRSCDGILVPGGFGERGWDGKVAAASLARKEKIPFLGICLGMQAAVVSVARDVLNWDANSSEVDAEVDKPVIGLISEWSKDMDLGGTMRLGAKQTNVATGTLLHSIHQADSIHERHRHRYEFNNDYRNDFEQSGLTFSGESKDGLVDVVEWSDHPWFLGCQYHPEFQSNPITGHPLFNSYIASCMAYKRDKEGLKDECI